MHDRMVAVPGSEMDKQYYLGIDGGGTKTQFALADVNGIVIRSHVAEGCNPMDIGIKAAVRILMSGIHQVCRGIPFSSIQVFAGIAGGSSGIMQIQIRDALNGIGFKKVDNGSDSLNIIAAGLQKENGIAIIMGTGICAFAQSSKGLERVAGWGYYIENGGSGYNIGRDGLNAYYCALDGSGEHTILTEKINGRVKEMMTAEDNEELTNLELHQYLLTKLYQNGKRLIASFAPMVFSAAQEGDFVAEGIIDRNAAEAAHMIEAAAARLPDDMQKIPVCAAGGLTKQEGYMNAIRNKFSTPERYQLQVLPCPPVFGAINLAKWL